MNLNFFLCFLFSKFLLLVVTVISYTRGCNVDKITCTNCHHFQICNDQGIEALDEDCDDGIECTRDEMIQCLRQLKCDVDNICTESGVFPVPDAFNQYYVCSRTHSGLIKKKYECSKGYFFSSTELTCLPMADLYHRSNKNRHAFAFTANSKLVEFPSSTTISEISTNFTSETTKSKNLKRENNLQSVIRASVGGELSTTHMSSSVTSTTPPSQPINDLSTTTTPSTTTPSTTTSSTTTPSTTTLSTTTTPSTSTLSTTTTSTTSTPSTTTPSTTTFSTTTPSTTTLSTTTTSTTTTPSTTTPSTTTSSTTTPSTTTLSTTTTPSTTTPSTTTSSTTTPSTTTLSTTTTSTTTTTKPTPPPLVCTSQGTFPHPTNCKMYYRCNCSLKLFFFVCPGTTYFNDIKRKCSLDITPTCQEQISANSTSICPNDVKLHEVMKPLELEETTQKPLPCKTFGNFPHPTDCTVYYRCSRTLKRYKRRCRKGTYYNEITTKCTRKMPERCKALPRI